MHCDWVSNRQGFGRRPNAHLADAAGELPSPPTTSAISSPRDCQGQPGSPTPGSKRGGRSALSRAIPPRRAARGGPFQQKLPQCLSFYSGFLRLRKPSKSAAEPAQPGADASLGATPRTLGNNSLRILSCPHNVVLHLQTQPAKPAGRAGCVSKPRDRCGCQVKALVRRRPAHRHRAA